MCLGSDATGKRRDVFKSCGDNNKESTTDAAHKELYKKKIMPQFYN